MPRASLFEVVDAKILSYLKLSVTTDFLIGHFTNPRGRMEACPRPRVRARDFTPPTPLRNIAPSRDVAAELAGRATRGPHALRRKSALDTPCLTNRAATSRGRPSTG